MSQTEWDRRVLLILGKEDELEPKDALGEEQSEYLKSIFGMADQGLLSRSSVMQMIYGVTATEMASVNETMAAMSAAYSTAGSAVAAFGAASSEAMQSMAPEELRKLEVSDPEIEPQNFASDTLLPPYSPKEEKVIRQMYEDAVENTNLAEVLEGVMVKPRRPLENLKVTYDVDFEKMERRILGVPEEDDE